MSYFVASPVVTKQTSGATVVASFGSLVFAADDYILIKVTNRQTSGTSITATGYTKPAGANSRNGNVSECWLYKKAVGGDTAPTVNIENAQVIVKVYQVRDADATTFLSATPTTQNWSSVSSFNHSTYSYGAGDLVIFSASSGTGLLQPRMKAADCTALNYSAQTSNCDAIEAYRQYTSSGTSPAITTYANASGSGQATVLVIKNKTSGAPQVDLRTALYALNWYGSHGATHQAVTWEAPSAFAATINGITCSTTAPTIGTNATVPTNIGIFTLVRSSESTSGAWVGGSHTITSADLTGLLFSLQWNMSTSSTLTRYGTEGIIIGFSDGTNYVTYRIVSQEKGWVQTTLDTIVAALGNAVVYASSGSINWAAVTRVAYLWHRAGSSATSDDLYIRNALLIPTTLATTPAYSAAMTGGCVAKPATAVDFYRAVTAWDYLGLATLQGANQVLSKIDCAFGDGTNPTYIDGSAVPISFPGAYSATRVDDWQMNWNVETQAVAVAVKTASTDTINLPATAIVAPNKQKFVFDSGSNTGAAVSIAGSSIIGTTFTDSAGFALTSGTFRSGGTVTLKNSATGLSVATTVGAVPAVAMTANSKTLTRCTTDVTGTSATYHLELSTAVDAITLADHTFTGSAATNKVHVLKTTGTVTITISGTTSLISADVTSAGATVVIAAPQPTLDATVLASSRVVLYNNTTDAELDNTAPAGTSWSKVITSGASANDSLTLHVFKEGYQEFQTTFLYTGDDATILVTQETDPNLTSLRTELGITDYTTITEFALDITGSVEIDADDADGSTTKARLAIWYNGVLTTENGARYLRGAITILSTAAFRINTSVLDLKIENISATFGLNFTDTERRLYRDDGAPIYAAASAPGSIQNDYSGVPDTVETGVSGLTGSESAQLMALPSAATIATQVLTSAQSAPIYADVRKVTGVTVTGVGTEADPWGP